MTFKGKVVLVTGGSGDLGGAIATQFGRDGAEVAIASSSREKLDRAAAAIRAAGGGNVLAIQRDLKQADAARAVVDEIVGVHGRIDVLVNCAGNFKRGNVLTLENDDWVDGFNLMFFGAVRVTRAAWPHLKQAGGAVVTVSGVHGVTPHATSMIGGTICAALINFNKALAEMGLADGVRVNCVVPGWIESWRLTSRVETLAREQNCSFEVAKRNMQEELGIVRFGRPDDVANLVTYLASPKAGFIHGQSYVLDGGLTKSL